MSANRSRIGNDPKSGEGDTDLEAKFDFYYRSLAEGYPMPDKQYRFGRWYLDRAFPELKISIELNGGARGGGRVVYCHNCGSAVRASKKDGSSGRVLRVPYPSHSGAGADRDAAKSNALQIDGWIALTFTSEQLDSDPVGVIGIIRKAIDLRKAVAGRSASRDHTESIASGDRVELTKRESDVLHLLAEGHTAAGIGFQLGIAPRTAELYIRRVREKFGVSSSTAAVARAVASGVVNIN